jgi:hypothetical protein
VERCTLGRPRGSGKLEPYRDFLVDIVTAGNGRSGSHFTYLARSRFSRHDGDWLDVLEPSWLPSPSVTDSRSGALRSQPIVMVEATEDWKRNDPAFISEAGS